MEVVKVAGGSYLLMTGLIAYKVQEGIKVTATLSRIGRTSFKLNGLESTACTNPRT